MKLTVKLAFCDLIADIVSRSVGGFSSFINGREHVNFQTTMPKPDLHPEEGYLLTTKKTVTVTDHQDKKYLITIEEL